MLSLLDGASELVTRESLTFHNRRCGTGYYFCPRTSVFPTIYHSTLCL